MAIINVRQIEEAIYNLCVQANTYYSAELYDIIYEKLKSSKDSIERQKLYNILKNIELAFTKKRPLCQDTGQVIIFLELGQNCQLSGGNINVAINNAVAKAYKENYFRKSVVKNAIFNRINTNDNTPAIIYTDIIEGDFINIKLLVKGAGSENYSDVKTLTPTATQEEIFEFIKQTINTAGEKSCPPYVIGIGAGGTIETAALLSKKAFFKTQNEENEADFISKLKVYLGDLTKDILDIKIDTISTHIASLPIAVTINCHSTRHAECKITPKEIIYEKQLLQFREIEENNTEIKEILVAETEKIKKLKPGERFFLTGEIYTARDAAHKSLFEDYQKGDNKIDLTNKIIFYTGPCPSTPNEIIGPIGPTTSTRMDGFVDFMQEQKLLATIGKGERSCKANKTIEETGGKYFVTQGGISCLLADCVKESEVILYEELGTEAIRKLYVKKLPLTVVI